MNQGTAETMNQYPNLIELIGRQAQLHGTAVWREPAIGSDEQLYGLDRLPAAHDNILRDEMDNAPLNAVSAAGRESIGQDEAPSLGFEAIGQDEIRSPRASGLDSASICNDVVLLQDEDPALNGMSICSDEIMIGQDETSGSPPASGLDRMSICSDDTTIGQDEAADISQVGTTFAS